MILFVGQYAVQAADPRFWFRYAMWRVPSGYFGYRPKPLVQRCRGEANIVCLQTTFVQFVQDTRIAQAISDLKAVPGIQIERVDEQHNDCLGYASCSFTSGCKMLDLDRNSS